MRVLISSIERNYRPGSLSIHDVLNARSSARFTLVHEDTTHFARHAPVEIRTDDDTTIWTGFLASPEERLPGPTGPTMFSDCECIDNHYLADKRRVFATYQNTTAGAIVNALITTYLAGEGITAGTVDTGPSILRALYDGWRVSDAIQELAERANFAWWIDKDRALFFQARTTTTAPRTLVLSDVLMGTLKVDGSAPAYRNRQWIRGVTDVTSSQTATFVGDSQNRSFTLGYQLDAAPTITLNAAAQTVGLKVDSEVSTAQWFYAIGDGVITQNTSGTVLTASDTLTVVYVGRFAVTVRVEDTSAQTTLAATEGVGTGIVEDVIDDTTQTSVAAGAEKADQLITRYATEPQSIEFATDTATDLAIGQLLTVDILEHNLSMGFLLQELELTEYPMTDRLRYQFRGSSGPVGEGWVKWLTQLLRVGDRINQAIMVGDVSTDAIVQVFEFSKLWALQEQPEVFEDIYPSVALFPSAGLRPGFPAQVVTYFAWGTGTPAGGTLGSEVGRKQVTSFVGGSSSHRTLVLLGRDEGNVAITEIAWYGGHRATAVADTGVLIEAVEWAFTKTSDDILQIGRTDTRDY